MNKPPDFVMYVVLVKWPGRSFDPDWVAIEEDGRRALGAQGFKKKSDAEKACRKLQKLFGKANAYVQQYGPYS